MSNLSRLNTPIFWAEGHPGKIDRGRFSIEITGACTKPATLAYDDILNLPKSNVDARLTSVTRWSVGGVWGGVKISDLLDMVGATKDALYIRFWSIGLVYDTSIPRAVSAREKSILAYEFDGEPLEEDYGGPVRFLCPYRWGYKSAKSVIKLELMDHYEPGYWEMRGYPDEALFKKGPVRDFNQNGKKRNISVSDNEEITFTDGK